jgi:PhoH-like ATPase
MAHSKQYVVDTNVLLEDPESLFKLRNGNENTVFIPYHVLLELGKLKKSPRLGHIVNRIIENLSTHPEAFKVLEAQRLAEAYASSVDHFILEEIADSGLDAPILVTNDRMLQLQAVVRGIRSEAYKESKPAQPEAEKYTGFVDGPEEGVPNSFCWNHQGKPVFLHGEEARVIDYQHRIWNITPRNVYQNLALEVMQHTEIPICSIQSDAGYGKSFLALATAFFLVLERKTHEKVYLVKPTIEIGQKLGYLPGRVEEKMEPYTRYITDLVLRLHRLRPANRVFLSSDEMPPRFNAKRFEILPLAYVRGMNIENAVVIVDEAQNLSRTECRALLSRMGEGVKCICLGDIHQVDNPYLNTENNGLNWIVSKFKGSRIYAHLVLKGDKSRGPITDLVIRSGL